MRGQTDSSFPAVTLPPERLEDLLDASRFLEQSASPALLLGPDGQQVELPGEVFKVLVEVVRAMAKRQAISMVPIDQKLTTQAAADFLGISRPTLIKHLEAGVIPYEKLPGSRHRRILLTDLLEYRDSQRARRLEIFQQMVSDAEEDGLYEVEATMEQA